MDTRMEPGWINLEDRAPTTRPGTPFEGLRLPYGVVEMDAVELTSGALSWPTT
jgi:hypothetical protein